MKHGDILSNEEAEMVISDYEKAIKEFEKISDFKDSKKQIAKCNEEINHIIQSREKAKKKLKIALITIFSAIAITTSIALFSIFAVPHIRYNKAVKLTESENYSEALKILNEMADYKDTADIIKYIDACIALKDGDFDNAIKQFEKFGDFMKSPDKLLESKYLKAVSLYKDENYIECLPIFMDIKEYSDSADKIEEIYQLMVSYMNDMKYAEAAETLMVLGDYKDSADLVETIYKQAVTYLNEEKYKYSAALFIKLNDYKDSVEQADSIYQKMTKLVDNKKYADAAPVLMKFYDSGRYDYAESQLVKIYNTAIDYKQKYWYYSAIKMFEGLGKFKDSESKLAELNELYDPDKDKKYNKAVKLAESGDYEEAEKAFKELGDYKDSKSKATEAADKEKQSDYDYAVSLMENGYYYDAKDAFEALGGYKDSKSKITEIEELIKKMTDISGEWQQVVEGIPNKLHSMTITSYSENLYKVKVNISSGAAYESEWSFNIDTNSKTQIFEFNNGFYCIYMEL